jgi:Fe-S-cluster-containing dehydrogenase component
MKKCTLCVDKIYNENLPEESRQPACVSACPANARHFGDLDNPDSNVSKMVKARGGYDLMPEQNTKPVNKYLPPRTRQMKPNTATSLAKLEDASPDGGFLGWVDKVLSD